MISMASTSQPKGLVTIHHRPRNQKPNDDDNLLFFPVPDVTKADIDRAGKIDVRLNEKDITIMSYNNKLYAFLQVCPHRGGPLLDGEIEEIPGQGPCIRCPWHGWKFHLGHGRCIQPNRPDVVAKVFPVRVDCPSHKVSVGFTEIAPEIFKQIPS